MDNLLLAFKKARKGKSKKLYVLEFEANFHENILKLHDELKSQTYKPEPLVNFVVKDPKTRKISKSAFRDRIVHHAIIRVIEPIFDKGFIYDSCANRVQKGTLFAIKRFELFKRKVTNNLKSEAFCFKADVKHYFQEVNQKILMEIIKRKISDEKVIWLIERILKNGGRTEARDKFTEQSTSASGSRTGVGMPLGNLTSQFFANVYLNELDYFVKHNLKAKFYIRYVDDFVILHMSKEQLEIWKKEIERFLRETLRLELHPQKSKIICLSRGIDFVGFRNFYHHNLLRKRSIRKMLYAVETYKQGGISKESLLEIFQGWQAYSKWAASYKLRRSVVKKIYSKKVN